MSDTLMRDFVDAALPDGALWRPAPGGDLDNFLQGEGDNLQAVMDDLTSLANARTPGTTTIFDDLEREFGITPDTTIPQATRVSHLAWKMFTRGTNGAPSDLQAALDTMGFGAGGYGLSVFPNDSPQPVAPATFIAGATAECYCGGSNAYCGYGGTAVCGFSTGGQLVVNGDVYQVSAAQIGCGYVYAVCGYGSIACCGGSPWLAITLITYNPPLNRPSWNFVFFIAAGATYDAYGNISALTYGFVPQNQLEPLKKLTLAMKPLSTWAVLYVSTN